MKKLITITTLILLFTTTLLPQAGCGGNTVDTEPGVPESNRWLEMLKIMPKNEDTLTAVSIQTQGYVELLRKQLEDAPEGINFATPELIAHNPLPLFAVTGYTDQEWDETLGFNVSDVTESIVAGSGPPRYYQAVRGNFSQEDIENAARNGPLNEHMEVVSYKGYEFYSWGEDMDMHIMDWRSNIRPLGRGHRLAYVDGFALWMLWTNGLEEMIDSYEGAIPSLVDREDYDILAGALEDMDTVTAFFSAEPLSLSEFKEQYKDRFDELKDEGLEQQITEFENEPFLEPYLSFATGAGEDEQGTYLVIVLANPDENTAMANADLLKRRINESKKYPFVKNSLNFQNNDNIESMEIKSEGRLTIAKLYGRIYSAWNEFAQSLGRPFIPLLIHE